MPRTYTCRRCGEQGHSRATCPRSLEFDGTYERARPMLGTMPDAELAKIVGASKSTVTTWRSRLGIPKAPRRNDPEIKYPGITTLLRTHNNAAIADVYGVSRERIRQIRDSVGIERATTQYVLPPDKEYLLGHVPDVQLAKGLGVPTWFVRRERLRAGIPVSSRTPHYESVIGRVHDRVGTVSDRNLARELGLPISQVSAYRRRHAIPPFVLTPQCEGFVPLDRGAIARMFHDGATDDEIARELGTTRANVCQIRYELRLIRPTRSASVPPDVVAEVRRRVAAGETRWRIAKDMGLVPSTVYRIASGSDE